METPFKQVQKRLLLFVLLITACTNTPESINSLCSKARAFNIGFEAIALKHPEYKKYEENYTVKPSGSNWWVLRTDEQFWKKPQEYPRAVISQKSCALQRILWSK